MRALLPALLVLGVLFGGDIYRAAHGLLSESIVSKVCVSAIHGRPSPAMLRAAVRLAAPRLAAPRLAAARLAAAAISSRTDHLLCALRCRWMVTVVSAWVAARTSRSAPPDRTSMPRWRLPLLLLLPVQHHALPPPLPHATSIPALCPPSPSPRYEKRLMCRHTPENEVAPST